MSKGYHSKVIKKGIIGEPSKIVEELEEFIDALDQKATIMSLIELSDLYGAIECYLEKYHPNLSMDDLKKMSELTKRAFKNGKR